MFECLYVGTYIGMHVYIYVLCLCMFCIVKCVFYVRSIGSVVVVAAAAADDCVFFNRAKALATGGATQQPHRGRHWTKQIPQTISLI